MPRRSVPPLSTPHASSALWPSLFERAPTPMMLLTATGRIAAVNRAWQTFSGLGDENVANGVLNYDLLADHALQKLQVRDLLVAALQGATPQNLVVPYDPAIHGRPGAVRHIRLSLTSLAQPTEPTGHLLVTLMDITASLEADAQRQAKEIQLRAVVDHAPALIFLKSHDHRFILANKAITRLFGMAFEGRYDYELFAEPEAEALHAWDQKIMNGGVAQTFEETLPSREGPRHFLTVKFPLRNEEGSVIGVGGVSQDITERVRAERENERLQISEKAAREADKVKSEFLATMSHEIRTPLAGIIGLARIVTDNTEDAESRKHLKNLDAAAHMLLHILNDVLDLSKLEAKKLVFDIRSFDLHSLVESTCNTLAAYASGKGLQLAWSIADGLPRYVVSDGGRIAQVLNNLVNNAIKFSDRGTVAIAITAKTPPPKPGLVGLHISVNDQGIGIRDEDLARLFTPFSQADTSISRRFGGTGLGLSICRAIVEGMGGTIEVSTALGKGSTFSFSLPLKIADYKIDEQAVSQPTHRLALSGRILVVEDNPVNQTIALHQLAKLGIQADLANHGASALAKVEGSYYDIILMDCHMPGMDGFEATKRIRALENFERSTVPIIALTANALAGERERCLAAGMTDYLTKPVNTQDLQLCLSRYLRSKVP